MTVRLKVKVHVRAPFERVKGALCDFASIGGWHPAYEECEVEGRGAGAIRRYRIGGEVYREQLLEVAEEGRGYRYALLEASYFFGEHEGYLWVRPDADGAQVEWAVKIRGASMPEEALTAMTRAVFEAGLAAAKATLEDGA